MQNLPQRATHHLKHQVVSAAQEPVRITAIKPSICPIDPDTAQGGGQQIDRTSSDSLSKYTQGAPAFSAAETHHQMQNDLHPSDIIPAEYIKEDLFTIRGTIRRRQQVQGYETEKVQSITNQGR